MAEKLTRLMDSFNNILDAINIMQDNQIKIEEQLLKVEQPYRNILDKVYIQGKTLVTVASEMNYDYKHMCYKHGISLNKFDELDK